MDKPKRIKRGRATTFHPIEKGLNNGKLACAAGAAWSDPNKPYCAMRAADMPCGVWVQIENVANGNTAWCKIMDRGPYGKLDKNGKWFNAAINPEQCPECKFKGIIDMGQSVADRLGSNGAVTVKVRWWKDNPLAPLLDEVYVNEI